MRKTALLTSAFFLRLIIFSILSHQLRAALEWDPLTLLFWGAPHAQLFDAGGDQVLLWSPAPARRCVDAKTIVPALHDGAISAAASLSSSSSVARSLLSSPSPSRAGAASIAHSPMSSPRSAVSGGAAGEQPHDGGEKKTCAVM